MEKITLWSVALLLAIASYSTSNAYIAMNHVDVHGKFKEIGLLVAGPHIFPQPAHKPAADLASN